MTVSIIDAYTQIMCKLFASSSRTSFLVGFALQIIGVSVPASSAFDPISNERLCALCVRGCVVRVSSIHTDSVEEEIENAVVCLTLNLPFKGFILFRFSVCC